MIDGEGTVTISKNYQYIDGNKTTRRQYRPLLQISNSHKKSLEDIKMTLNVGDIIYQSKKHLGNRVDMYVFRVLKQSEIFNVLSGVIDCMIIKKERI